MNKQELRNKIHNLEAELMAFKEELDKELKFNYPICMRSKSNDKVVLFNSLNSGIVLFKGESVFHQVGKICDDFIPHTDETWEEIPYDEDRGLYHKQMVYCWSNEWTHQVAIKFYDALNQKVFSYDGYNSGIYFDRYSATMPNFMLEAHKTLKD